ncbi:hypothetical protein [Methylobacterium pseudosasicola]|uniref:hypothetical protein n=1 Tax=Methylobacterium pseudosasicola TaxID=582667 RepID=UPI001113E9FC|nr:hypothetical protein [Methylobacterium pseudosasicola]
MDRDAQAYGLDEAPARSALGVIEPRDDEAVTVPPDRSGIVRCHFGFGVQMLERNDGRCGIAVDPQPPAAADPNSRALRQFMEATAVEWLRQVAPHRLSDAFRSGY